MGCLCIFECQCWFRLGGGKTNTFWTVSRVIQWTTQLKAVLPFNIIWLVNPSVIDWLLHATNWHRSDTSWYIPGLELHIWWSLPLLSSKSFSCCARQDTQQHVQQSFQSVAWSVHLNLLQDWSQGDCIVGNCTLKWATRAGWQNMNILLLMIPDL